MAGVVGHPVSEKGRQSGSPSTVSNGNTRIALSGARAKRRRRRKAELACFLERETSSVKLVVDDGVARYSKRERLKVERLNVERETCNL